MAITARNRSKTDLNLTYCVDTMNAIAWFLATFSGTLSILLWWWYLGEFWL